VGLDGHARRRRWGGVRVEALRIGRLRNLIQEDLDGDRALLVGLDGVHVLRWPPVDSTSAKDLVGAGRGRGPSRPEG